jgi:exonuclease VII small subunit
VSFFLWQFKGSLALVLLVSMAVGALISFLASLPTNIRVRWAFRNQRKRLSEIEASLEEHKQKLEDAQNKLEQAVQPPEVEKETPQEPQPEDETQA